MKVSHEFIILKLRDPLNVAVGDGDGDDDGGADGE